MARAKLGVHPLLPTLALTVGLCFLSQPSFGQSADDASRNTAGSAPANSQPTKVANAANSNTSKDKEEDPAPTFRGRIVKSGSKFVLAATDDTTYQLDDQRKAHNFLNQDVKVTGVLDATTGTIRVDAIDPV
ncbi:MAG: DUF5818 domain-containing protein [Terriglobales bacterium]|jgi:uncharacterized protein DUF5818